MATKQQTLRRDHIYAMLQLSTEGLTAREVSERAGIHYTTANDDLNVLRYAGKALSEGGPAFGTARTWRAV